MKIFAVVERSLDISVGYDLKNWSLPFSITLNFNIGYFGLEVGPFFISAVVA